LSLARELAGKNNKFHFIWIGNIAPSLEPWFKLDMETPALKNCFHHVAFTSEISLYYQAADIFVLTSREDPLPSVVIDALANGLPVVAFDKCGGYVDLINSKQKGELVPYGDVEAMANVIERIVNDKTMHTEEAKKQRSEPIIREFDFKQYVSNIMDFI